MLLGDTSLANMAAIPASVWDHPNVRLRVWFDDGTTGSQLLSPDRRLASNGYPPDGAVSSAKIAAGAVGSAQLAAGAITSANIAAGSVGSTQMAAGAAAANLAASGPAGVASGGVVLSATDNAALVSAGYVKIGTTFVNATASARAQHTAVWTGTEMIVWGGYGSGVLNDGASYNPPTSTWPAVTTADAPAGRSYHTAVWTGSEMIVWSGYSYNNSNPYLNDGGRYNPTTNSWTAMTNTGAPGGRGFHTAV